MPLDVDRLASAMLEGVQALIAKATAPLVAEIDAVKAENALLLKRVEVAESRDFPAFDLSPIEARVKALEAVETATPPAVREIVQEALSARPEPVTPDVVPMVAEAVKAAVEALPAPRDWSEDIEALRKAIPEPVELPKIPEMPDLSAYATRAELTKAIAAIPEPEDWGKLIGEVLKEIPTEPDKSGLVTRRLLDEAIKSISLPETKDWSEEIATIRGEIGMVRDGTKSMIDGIKMPEVIHGKNGAGIADARQNDDGELILKLTTGDTLNVGKVRGGDGLGFDDMTVEDGEREFEIVFAKGEQTKRFALMKPILKDCGVWREGEFRKGDGVTWAGSFWIAQRDTTDKPETSDAWRLAVKRGRDGKNLTPPEPRGPVKR